MQNVIIRDDDDDDDAFNCIDFYFLSPGKQGCYNATPNPWLYNPNGLNRPDFPPLSSIYKVIPK